MKHFLSAVIFIGIAITGYSQNEAAIAQRLYQTGVIQKSEIKSVSGFLQKAHDTTMLGKITAVYNSARETLLDKRGENTAFMVSFEDSLKRLSFEKSKVGLRLYLAKLKLAGLVDEDISQYFDKRIEQDTFMVELLLLSHIHSYADYREWLNPADLLKFANSLLAEGIADTSGYNRLTADIKAGKIKSEQQLVVYCRHAVFFDWAEYSDDPASYLQVIHRKVAGVFPQLAFENFNWQIVVDSSTLFSDYVSYNVVVSFVCNGRLYTHESFISPLKSYAGNYLGKIDEQEFYQIFNKVLVDVNSPYRLHLVKMKSEYGHAYDWQHFGIVALQRPQTAMFRYMESYMDVSYESFKGIGSDRIKSIVAEYDKLGLFKHLTATQIADAGKAIERQQVRNVNDILSAYPDVLYGFDTEMENVENPYVELLKIMSAISHGAFEPTDIQGDFDLQKSKTKISFKLNGKTYSKQLQVESDWMDLDVLDFIGAVLKENKVQGEFYELYTGGQDALLVFLTPVQYEYLRLHKLLLFGDQAEEVDE